MNERGDRPDAANKADGFIAYASGHYEAAVDYLTKIVDPYWIGFDTRYVLARANLYLGQYETAADELRQVLTDYSDIRRLTNALWAVDAYFYLASAEELAGETNLAIEHYEKFLDIRSEADSSLVLVEDAGERLTRLKAGL